MDNGQRLTRSVPTCTLMQWTGTQLGGLGSIDAYRGSPQQGRELELTRCRYCVPHAGKASESLACRANLRMTSWPTHHRHMAYDMAYDISEPEAYTRLGTNTWAHHGSPSAAAGLR